MSVPARELDRFLDDLARQASPGERLPTIRELMRRFGASQGVVQRAFETLKRQGLIESQVGRGTHFVGQAVAVTPVARQAAPVPSTATRQILLMRRSISVARGRALIDGLNQHFSTQGHRVLEVSYTDPEHARSVLRALPRFDACVVQSTYRTIPVDLLAGLREKCEVLAVDGMALVGADVEAVGVEWGEPLAAAVDRLHTCGHSRIAFAGTEHPLLAVELGRRRWAHLARSRPELDLPVLSVPALPDGDYEARLMDELQARQDAGGRLPFSALVAWGIEDGERWRARMAEAGWRVPEQLSVVLLGRTDLPNEHGGFFDVMGCSVAELVKALVRRIEARWADPGQPYRMTLVPLESRQGASVAALRVSPSPARARPSRA